MTEATTPKQSRRWNWGLPITDRAFEPYVTAMGQLTLAWNGLHETLAILFSMVMGGGDVGKFLAIWHAIKVDRTQRDILLAAARADQLRGFESYPRLVPDLEWICDKAHKVEGARNDALHSPLWGSQRGPGSTLVMPAAGLGHVRAQKLLAKDLLTDFNWCRDASLVLTKFARELDAAMSDFGLVWPDTPAWRDRPTLPPRQSAPKVKPTRPPRSSRASGT